MNIWKYITNKEYRDKIKTRRTIRRLIIEANERRKLTGYKHYVMYLGGKLRVVNNRSIDLLKKEGLLPKTFDWIEAAKHSVYIAQ